MAHNQRPTKSVTPVEQLVRDRIRKHGPVPVSDYMNLALAHPDHGYYRKADPLGRDGDFTTAPEISQVFGEILGLWCVVTWQQAGQPTPVRVVELGPGRGTLMADALRAAATVPEFLAAATIHLVETSPALRKRQEEILRHYSVSWHSSAGEIPTGPCIVLANEFFDALPIDQFVKTKDGWAIRCVGIDPAPDSLAFVAGHVLTDTVGNIPPALAYAPIGSVFETCLPAHQIFTELGTRLSADGIAALIIDYGHSRQGIGDTLQGVQGHTRHDVLKDPGDADLTAHLDFSALAAAAQAAGARPFGPVPQGTFLRRLGIEARTERLAAGCGRAQAELLLSGCHRLIDGQGMGTLFKVLALTGGNLGVPAGFEPSAETLD